MVLRVLFLVALWCVLSRELSLANILLGLVASTLLVRSVGARTGEGPGRAGSPRRRAWAELGRRSVVRPLLVLELTGYFLWELLVSNVRIALLVLRAGPPVRPAILSVPVETRSEAELALVSDLVTLTPGTLSLDVEDDGRTLLVHVLSTDDEERARRQIQQGLVRRVRRVFA